MESSGEQDAKSNSKKRPGQMEGKESATGESTSPCAASLRPDPPSKYRNHQLFALRQRGYNRLYLHGRIFEFSLRNRCSMWILPSLSTFSWDRLAAGADISSA